MIQDTCAVVAAGGKGERFGRKSGKQYVDICGKPMVAWSVRALLNTPSIGCIVVARPVARAEEMRALVAHEFNNDARIIFADAQETRQKTVLSGLLAAQSYIEVHCLSVRYTAIHDGARPLIRSERIERAIEDLRAHKEAQGVICAHRMCDTLKLVDGTTIEHTPDRSLFWAAQTPQVFDMQEIIDAHKKAEQEGFVATDDASLIEHFGGVVLVHESERDNIKVTMPEDLAVAETLMACRLREAQRKCHSCE